MLLAALVRSLAYSALAAETHTDEASSERVTGLVRQHVRPIFRTARDLGVAERDLEDVCQEVLLIALRRLTDIEPGKERAFLLATTSRVASNYRRTRHRRPADLHAQPEELQSYDAPHAGTTCSNPESLAARQQELSRLQEALAAMTEAQRVAFTLFELEELTAREIAEQLGTTEVVIFARVRRARAVFRRFYRARACSSEGRS